MSQPQTVVWKNSNIEGTRLELDVDGVLRFYNENEQGVWTVGEWVGDVELMVARPNLALDAHVMVDHT